MDEKKIKRIIKQAFQEKNLTITSIERTPGGLTNESYFATINDEKYVVRIPGKGTKQLVNRVTEKDNLLYATKLGINPELIYFDVDSGLKITRKVENASPMTLGRAREGTTMKQIINSFKQLHNAKKPMKNHFELFSLISHYRNLVYDTNPLMLEKWEPLQADLDNLREVYESLPVIEVPCHIDTVCSNILLSDSNEIFLIDWEYSGMFDAFWDLATLFVSLQFTEKEEQFFLTHYLEREPLVSELQRILLHKIFHDYLWS